MKTANTNSIEWQEFQQKIQHYSSKSYNNNYNSNDNVNIVNNHSYYNNENIKTIIRGQRQQLTHVTTTTGRQ